jgi:type IV secretion system protein VirB5
MTKRISMIAGGVALAMSMAAPAHAQLAVIDGSNLVQALNTARNTLQQIQQAQQLYTALNNVSNIGSVAGILNSPVLRSALPDGMQSTLQLISTDLSELGAIGARAQSLLGTKNLSLSSADAALGDQAYAEHALNNTQLTAQGLGQLKDQIASATTLKQSSDLNARASLENAQINNQILQMMAQQQAARNAAALQSAADFAAAQRAEAAAISSGSDRPTWKGQ